MASARAWPPREPSSSPLGSLRLTERLELGNRVAGVLLLFRRMGLPLLGLAFFLLWTIVYVGLWAFDPGHSFAGLERLPRFADFFYYAVSTAFISPPGDIFAKSRGARSATMIEMLTAFALLTAYLSSFVDWYGPRREPERAAARLLVRARAARRASRPRALRRGAGSGA